ncbi:MAG TPA: SDR family oxidoreductase [Thiobacillus sp.]|nr:MAG: NAD(P)-dependent oxidoreductase [Hydrogenophilales bacterium 28-61-11]OYZ58132.1 MAG: NAD(P)-dependent oxidoreductase [Hydrogenophilales bacterium 16-61-112]HQT29757.1 SDR family oxidoreductase [Thiobacillus sp.]HQT70398.1 SDR family oxidoreductase [Thiobacillus sp.]
MKTILIVGFGDVAGRLVQRYAGQAHFIGLIRRPERAAELRALGVTPSIGDLDNPASLRRLPRVDGVLHLAPPPATGETDPRTRHLLHALLRHGKPGSLVYISTSGVYGDCGGNWVAETRPVAPVNGRAVRRVDAERQLRSWGECFGVQVSILRAPGIYAADRLPLDRIKRGTPALIAAEDSYTNHIHADDLARLTWAALFRGRSQRIYHAVDAHPLKMGDWFDSCADAFNLPRPPRVKRAEAENVLSEALLSFLRESRQLSNARTTRELRLKYRYPTSDDLLKEISQVPAENPQPGQIALF